VFVLAEKCADRVPQRARDHRQPTRRDPVRAVFVFLQLLERDADRLGEDRLRKPALDPQRAHARADLGIG
jgi:hypothetical protein